MVPLGMFEDHVFHIRSLHERGFTKRQIKVAVENGSLIKLRRGWYASPHGPTNVMEAVTHGLRLTCVSAAKFHGLWTPLHHGLHVFWAHGRPEGFPQSMIAHPRPNLRAWPDERPIAPLDLALLHAGRCLPVPEAAVLFESAVNQGKIPVGDALEIIDGLPNHQREQLSRINPLAQSGTETLVRWFLESRGVQVRAQALIEGVGYVDMLIGESLVIECDSVAHHAGTEQYYGDRRRDAELIRQGYLPIRLTWEDVCVNWEATKERLKAILATRRHRFLRPILG